jgi:hypothetical protein
MAPAQRYFASTNSADVTNEADDDEDDFMSDKYLAVGSSDDSKRPKTYSQMRKEAQKRSEEKGYIKSRAEREKEAREEGLKRNLLLEQNSQDNSQTASSSTSSNNKALDMMMKMGFKPGQALGKRMFGDDAPAASGQASPSQSETDDNEDDGFIPLRSGIGAKRAAPVVTESKPSKDTARADDRRIDPIEIQMRQGECQATI